MQDLKDLTINWDRCIYIDQPFNEELVKILTPEILSLRQKSNDPITIAINSVGGDVATIDTLIGLVKGPNQDGKSCTAITVVTSHAYSAAASLLALGDYAVAMPHSDILFHDTRYGRLQDVTPDAAKAAAKRLMSANERASLRLNRPGF